MTQPCIGVVVVGHGNFAPAMVQAARSILGDISHVVGVAIDSSAPVELNRQQIASAIREVDLGHGVVLLTDMFGGTPSNLCLSFLQPKLLEVISGVNLPMLIKLAGGLQREPFEKIIPFLQIYGQKNIVNASNVLQGKLDE
ncbi:MAG: PTS sugar transporter subunit IIA [Deltaproteobacteria bacterium]|nr:PTS sugar transporter subunit IIA [Deltaproteobacteria bacterium]